MRTVKRSLCLLLAVLLLAGLVPGPAAAAETVYFTAVNQTLLELNDETMPFWLGGTLYVPASAVSYGDPPELGVFYNRNRERMTVVLYKEGNAITFYYATGLIETNNGQNYSGSVIIRGDVVFLPLDVICRFFGLSYSYTRTTYGYLVRIKSDSVVLSDAKFIDAASMPMAQRYARYERAKASASDEPAAPAQNDAPQTVAQRTVYFVVESTDAGRTVQTLSSLTAGRAAFLFTPQTLIGSGDLLRRLAAGGGAVALRVDASDGAEAALARIEEGNRALWAAASVKTRLVRLDGASDETAQFVAEAGYCPLRFTLDYGDSSVSVSRMSARILSAADANGGGCCVFLGTDVAAADILSALLAGLRAGNCTPARLNEVVF